MTLLAHIKKHVFLRCFFVFFFVQVSAAEFDTFVQQLDELETVQEQLALVERLQGESLTWPLEEQAKFLWQKGLVHQNNGDVSAARVAFTKSVNVFIQLNQPNYFWVRALLDRSYLDYLETNDPDVYCVDRHEALKISRQLGEPDLLASTLVRVGFCYQKGNESFQKGLALLEEAAVIAKENELAYRLIAMIHNATGNLYRNNQLHDKSYTYYQRAYDAWAEDQSIPDMFNMQHNLVGESIKLGLWSQADEHLKLMETMAKDHTEFKDFKFFVAYNHGLNHYTQGKFEQAIVSLKEALSLSDTTNEKYFVTTTKGMLAVAYFRDQRVSEAGQVAAEFLKLETNNDSLKQLAQEAALIRECDLGDCQAATLMLWELLDDSKRSKAAFIANSVAFQSVAFDQKLNDLKEQALANRLTISELELDQKTKQNQIHQLELEKEKTRTKINRLTIAITTLVGIGFLLAAWFFYRSSKNYKKLSQTDFLTQVANRRHIMQTGKRLFKDCKENDEKLFLAIMDLDNFKQINDQCGHVVGDQAIRSFAQLIQKILGNEHHFGRIGGEEFMLLMPSINSGAALSLVEDLRLEVSKHQFSELPIGYAITFSCGVAPLRPHDQTIEDLIKRADRKMYRAKNTGKNKIVFDKIA